MKIFTEDNKRSRQAEHQTLVAGVDRIHTYVHMNYIKI